MISVVIPTHNRADLLERAVKSVLNQTYKEFEIIVVSDGSSDNTDEVVERLKDNDERIKYISYHPGKGGNVARNTGIKEANYDYIAFLDDDDEWLPEKLEKQISILESNPKIGLVYTGINAIYIDQNISYVSSPSEKGDLAKKILFKNYIGTTSTVLLRKSILKKSGVFDIELKAMQDYDLWIRVLQHSEAGVLPEPYVNYYNYSGNKQISQQTNRYIEAFNYISEKYNNEIMVLSKSEKREREKNFYLSLANKAMRNNEKKLAIKYSIKALQRRISLLGFFYLFSSIFNYSRILWLRKIAKVRR